MTRKLAVLVSAFIVAAFVGAVAVSPALAEEPALFHSEASHTTLTGEQVGTDVLTVNGGNVECKKITYKGTAEVQSPSEITLEPSYSECTAFGFAGAEVKVNGCAYVLHSGTKEGGNLEGSFDIECPEGKTIEFIATLVGTKRCTLTLPAQKGLGTLTYVNEGAGTSRDYKANLSLSAVKYTQDAGTGLGVCSSGSFENGKYSGTATVKGENSKEEKVGVWVE
jgi:hypothetical protein